MAHQHQKKSSEQVLEHKRILDAGLKLLSADDLKPSTPCPDSWTFALYVQGQADEQARRTINSHIALCGECYREYLALAEPEDVMKEVDRELHSTTARPERSPDAWRHLMERLKSFVIDLGKTYGVGPFGRIRIVTEGLALATRGKYGSKTIAKVFEIDVGTNTYSIELALLRDGSVMCDIVGSRIGELRPLLATVRLESGEMIFSKSTNVQGNAHFTFARERVEGQISVLDLQLNGWENQAAFWISRDS